MKTSKIWSSKHQATFSFKKTILKSLFCIFPSHESSLMVSEVCICLFPLTPVMTAEDPWDTNNREKNSRKKDLMMKSRLCAAMPSRVKIKDAEAVGPCCMCMRDRPQRQMASKLMCWGLAEVYKPSPPFKKHIVTHSHQHHLTEGTKKDQGKL